MAPPTSPAFSQAYEPVSPIDITHGPKRTRSVGFTNDDSIPKDETTVRTRSIRTDSTSSTTPSLKTPRKARFAEATSVLSPAAGPGETRSPFADPKMAEDGPKPSDVGFGYIADSQPREQFATVRSDTNGGTSAPLKSALKTPGTGARLLNPLSPTFKEEMDLERQEEKTDKEQARDLKIKTRVRMAKMVLRGVNFSCSLIVLAMLSTVLTIFHATKALPARNNLPAWAPKTPIWPQIVVLTIACISLLFAIVVLAAYCRGGHKRAEKVAVYYTMFALGWFMFSIIMWLVGAGILQGTKSSGGGQDLWGWSCKDNKRRELFEEDVHYALVCRLQDWALICCIIEVVVEVIVIAIYGIVFYRFWSKNKLRKSMDARDRARTDLYLAQLRSQSAPNTPGFMQTPRAEKFQNVDTPRTPGFPSMNRTANVENDDDEQRAQYVNTTPNSNATSSPFKLQAPPSRNQHTPRSNQDGFEPAAGPSSSFTPPPPTQSPPPQERINQHVAAAPGEQTYDAVPIPGAYDAYQHQPSGPSRAF